MSFYQPQVMPPVTPPPTTFKGATMNSLLNYTSQVLGAETTLGEPERGLYLPHALVSDVTAFLDKMSNMVGEDGYYVQYCRVCERGFQHSVDFEHEDWCPVPVAQKLRTRLLLAQLP